MIRFTFAFTFAFTIAARAAAQDPIAAAGKSIGDTMATAGGYGLAGVFALAIVALWRKNEALQERAMTLVTKMTEVLTEHNINTKRQNELLEDVLKKDR